MLNSKQTLSTAFLAVRNLKNTKNIKNVRLHKIDNVEYNLRGLNNIKELMSYYFEEDKEVKQVELKCNSRDIDIHILIDEENIEVTAVSEQAKRYKQNYDKLVEQGYIKERNDIKNVVVACALAVDDAKQQVLQVH